MFLHSLNLNRKKKTWHGSNNDMQNGLQEKKNNQYNNTLIRILRIILYQFLQTLFANHFKHITLI